jgi:hypothetical protein
MDTFNFYGNASDTVIIFMTGTGGNIYFKAGLRLYDPNGIQEVGVSGSITNHQLHKTGLYTIVCQELNNWQSDTYNLSFLKIPGPVLSPSDKDGGDIASGELLSGQINPVPDTDGFNFYGNAGETVNIIMTGTGGNIYFQAGLHLYDPDGIHEVGGSGSTTNHQLLKTGLYTIVCQELNNWQADTYNLSLTKIPFTLPPGVYNPTPSNGSLVMYTASLLDWSDTQGATHYDVYFGTNVLIPLVKIEENITSSHCSLPPLNNDTTYFWKVVARNGSSEIPGPVWTFTTGYIKNDILGTWDSSGVWYRNSESGSWVLLTTPADMVAAGDVDGDGVSDLIGVWGNGLWVKLSATSNWSKLSTIAPTHIASGDMNGDGRDDVLGTWASGVWFRDSMTGLWNSMSSSAIAVAAGDIDGDKKDDLIGVWSSGLWVKNSGTGKWLFITSVPPTDISSGDLNGDGRDDVLGVWPSGVWYRNSKTGAWVKMSCASASLVAAGDIDGDKTDDLIGTWSSGLWVKNSLTASWELITTSLPSDIDAGLFRTGAWDAGRMDFVAPAGGYAGGPGSGDYIDLSDEGPGGRNFVYQKESHLVPLEVDAQMKRTPGPGEPGFTYIEQKNLMPRKELGSKKKKRN